MKRFVCFQEDQKIIAQIDEFVKTKGINRSGFLRSIIREKLRRLDTGGG